MTDESQAPQSDEDHRERRIRWTIFAVGVAVFIGVMVLGRPLVAGRLEAARNLDRATSMIAETNDDLAVVDAAVRAEVATSAPVGDARIPAAIEKLRLTLEEAQLLSESGYDHLTTDEQKRAVVVRAMATARLELLDAAELFFLGPGVYGGPSTDQALERYDAAAEKVREADAAHVKL